MAGITNILELYDLLDASVDAIEAARADGKIDWKDLPKFASLWGELKAALDGVQNITIEAKDLDTAEVQVLVARSVVSVQKLYKLFSALKGE